MIWTLPGRLIEVPSPFSHQLNDALVRGSVLSQLSPSSRSSLLELRLGPGRLGAGAVNAALEACPRLARLGDLARWAALEGGDGQVQGMRAEAR